MMENFVGVMSRLAHKSERLNLFFLPYVGFWGFGILKTKKNLLFADNTGIGDKANVQEQGS